MSGLLGRGACEQASFSIQVKLVDILGISLIPFLIPAFFVACVLGISRDPVNGELRAQAWEAVHRTAEPSYVKPLPLTTGSTPLGMWMSLIGLVGGGMLMGGATALAGYGLVETCGEGSLTARFTSDIALGLVAVVQLGAGPLMAKVFARERVLSVGWWTRGGALIACARLETLEGWRPMVGFSRSNCVGQHA